MRYSPKKQKKESKCTKILRYGTIEPTHYKNAKIVLVRNVESLGIIFHFQMKIRLNFVLVLASLCLAWPARDRGEYEYIKENPSDIKKN